MTIQAAPSDPWQATMSCVVSIRIRALLWKCEAVTRVARRIHGKVFPGKLKPVSFTRDISEGKTIMARALRTEHKVSRAHVLKKKNSFFELCSLYKLLITR